METKPKYQTVEEMIEGIIEPWRKYMIVGFVIEHPAIVNLDYEQPTLDNVTVAADTETSDWSNAGVTFFIAGKPASASRMTRAMEYGRIGMQAEIDLFRSEIKSAAHSLLFDASREFDEFDIFGDEEKLAAASASKDEGERLLKLIGEDVEAFYADNPDTTTGGDQDEEQLTHCLEVCRINAWTLAPVIMSQSYMLRLGADLNFERKIAYLISQIGDYGRRADYEDQQRKMAGAELGAFIYVAEQVVPVWTVVLREMTPAEIEDHQT